MTRRARHTTTRALAAFVLPLAVAVAGCGAEGAGGAAAAGGAGGTDATVRDSAGIRIVENRDSAWTEATRWRLAESPDFVIGSFDGSAPGTDFGDVVQARAMGDRVVVTDMTSPGFRVFDETGTFVEQLGRRGEGPTEIQYAIEWDVLGTDTIVVWALSKTVVFDAASGEASSYAPGAPPVEADTFEGLGADFQWMVRGWFRDGSYVMMNNPDPRGDEPGLATQYLLAERMRPEGEHVGSLGAWAMQRYFTTPDGELMAPTFPTVGHVATSGMHLWHAFADSAFEVRRIDARSGAVDRLVRLSTPPTEVDDAMVVRMREFEDRQIERVMEQMGDQMPAEMLAEMQRGMEEMRAQQPDARYAPLVVGLRPLPSGHLLVDLPDWEWRFQPTQLMIGEIPADMRATFAVIDPDGRWLGTLEAPYGLAVTDVTDDYVVGYRKDEFDVPYVERWRIVRP